MPLVTKPFSNIITFTRASTGTFTGSNGLIQTATTNTPRFDYDPVTLAAKGLLIEEQRTNLLTYSEQFDNAAWNKSSNCTVTANNTTAPDGATTADRIVISAATNISGPYNTVGTLSGLHTQSWYVKQAATVRYVQLLWTSAGVSSDYANFDLQTGTLTAGTYSGANIQNVGNGWYRISLTSTLAAVAGGCWITAINTSTAVRGASYPGTGAESFFAWGVQVEAGAFPTSYIPTVASQVTRSADVASVNTLSPWYNATEGTIYCEGDRIVGASSRQLSISDGTSNNFISLYSVGSDALQYATGVVGGATSWDLSRSPVLSGVPFKQGLGYALNNVAFVLNGGSPNTDITATSPTVDRMLIGQSPAGANAQQNQHIRKINYYPRRLSNAELQALTA